MTVWLTSDTHWGHENILKFEPARKEVLGQDIESHDIALIKRINSKVKPHDTLYILGDIGFGNITHLQDLVGQINTKNLVLVRGNHDKHSDAAYRKIGFSWVCYEAKIKIGKDYVYLSHYPYRPAWYVLLFNSKRKNSDMHKRPVNHGHFLLHGHIHSGGNHLIQRIDRQIHIGVDANNYYPVSLEQVANIIQKCKEIENERKSRSAFQRAKDRLKQIASGASRRYFGKFRRKDL